MDTFAVRRLEVSKIYHLRTLESLKILFLQVFRNHPEVSLECPWSRLPVPLEAKIELWLEPGAKYIIPKEGAAFSKSENHPSVEQVLAAAKSDATSASVPNTLCFPLFLSGRSKGKFNAVQDDVTKCTIS